MEKLQNIINIAKDSVDQSKTTFDIFYKTHIAPENSSLVMTLKFHLYAEDRLEKIIKMVLPNPNGTVLGKYTSFGDKLNLFKAIARPHDKRVINQLVGLNEVRNKFAHNIDMTLQETSTTFLLSFAKLCECSQDDIPTNTTHRLSLFKNALMGLCGNLDGLVHRVDVSPMTYLMETEGHIKEDQLLQIDTIYPRAAIQELGRKLKEYVQKNNSM